LISIDVTIKSCQPELVEGGIILKDRVRQAHPDNLLKLEPMLFAKSLNFFMSASAWQYKLFKIKL
jgi:hypothetical protein